MDCLTIWTVYDNVVNWPPWFVAYARCVPANLYEHRYILCKDVDVIREELASYGCILMQRMPGDAPQILEVWL